MCSIVELAEKSCGSSDPVSGWRVDIAVSRAGQLHTDDVVGRGAGRREDTLTQASLVHGARVFVLLRNVVFSRFEVDQRHSIVKLVWVLIIYAFLFAVIASTVHEQTIDQDSILWLLFHFCRDLSLNDFE